MKINIYRKENFNLNKNLEENNYISKKLISNRLLSESSKYIHTSNLDYKNKEKKIYKLKNMKFSQTKPNNKRNDDKNFSIDLFERQLKLYEKILDF